MNELNKIIEIKQNINRENLQNWLNRKRKVT